MACCTRYCAGETQFDSKVAQRDLRRYRRRGADATTRLMLAELRRWPLEGQQLLDVGGGIGVISAELAGTGWPLWAGLWVGKSPRTPQQPTFISHITSRRTTGGRERADRLFFKGRE